MEHCDLRTDFAHVQIISFNENVDRVQRDSVGADTRKHPLLCLDCFLQLLDRRIFLNLDREKPIFAEDDAGYCIDGWIVICHCYGSEVGAKFATQLPPATQRR